MTEPNADVDLELIAKYRKARQALRKLVERERAAGVKTLTPERLAARERFDEVYRRVPWHLR